MANIKSAKKRIKVSKTKQERNKLIKSKIKMFIKKVESFVASNDKQNANSTLVEATKQIDMAATKGVYHKNNAGRKISRLTKLVNNIK